MNIDEMRLKDVVSLAASLNGDPPPVEVGKNYLIRTVTFIQVGRVVSVTGKWVVLEDAAWIADTGRFNNCLTEHTFSEVEPFPDPVIVSTGSIVEITRWNGELPRVQK